MKRLGYSNFVNDKRQGIGNTSMMMKRELDKYYIYKTLTEMNIIFNNTIKSLQYTHSEETEDVCMRKVINIFNGPDKMSL